MNLSDPVTPSGATWLVSGTRLPVARYRFDFRMHDELRLPDFAGSLLRGQFGAALRRTACMTRARTCDGCPLLATCPYPAIFDAPAPPTHSLQKFSSVPNPYVIEPPPLGTRLIAAGDTLSFVMVLVGRAREQLPLIVFSLQRAVRHGLGRRRARGELAEIFHQSLDGGQSVWDAHSGHVLAHEASVPLPSFAPCREALLEIVTPLRLQDNGRPAAGDALSPRRLLTALMRRASLLFEFHAGLPGPGEAAREGARLAESLESLRHLTWHDWTRYSSRQKREMTLGGVMGSWTLRGDLTPLLPWLWLGQWLHVGKNATMGMGRYTLHQVGD